MGVQYFALFQVKLKIRLEIAGHDIHFTYMHFFKSEMLVIKFISLKKFKSYSYQRNLSKAWLFFNFKNDYFCKTPCSQMLFAEENWYQIKRKCGS